MASAVLANRNESNWGQSLGGFMGKSPYSTPQLNPNPNPNSKTKPKKKQFQTVNDLPAVTQAASDDAYSFNQRPIEPDDTHNHGSHPYPYVNFNVSAYSRSELSELRKRLVAELEQIQNLNDRIQSGKLQPRSNAKVKKLPSNKRPMPFGSENGNGNVSLMKMCRQILTKLMKPKHSWVFNMPVDAAALGLHDYHQIIKRPMDLGTIKSNFAKNSYSSPADFAADVRLTFNNAMMYNPKTDQVHVVASQLLDRFEELYKPILDKLGSGGIGNHRNQFVAGELQGSSWNEIPTPERPKKPKPTPMPKKIERVQNQSSSSNPPSKPPALNPPPLVQSPVQTPSPIRAQPVKPASARGVLGKQPKPRAKDPHKREMSMEEKQKLGMGLQNLPQEKMPQLVQIIRKRNDHLAQEGDEIELDIEALDTETLWELDRFVTNWKKFVSKTKRQALMGNNYNSAAATTTAETDEVGASEIMDVAKRPRKGEAGEEDVDIGDEMPESSFPPVEIEKDDVGNGPGRANANATATATANANSSSSSSSSSGSDSSSSSDSDSGSSSGSDSDADEAQS